jgi:hypothetical protein
MAAPVAIWAAESAADDWGGLDRTGLITRGGVELVLAEAASIAALSPACRAAGLPCEQRLGSGHHPGMEHRHGTIVT